MVVAAGASQRHAEERLPEGIDPVVSPVGRILGNVDRRMDLLAEIPETGAEHRQVGAGGVQPGGVEEVPRDLLADELVVRKIGVEAVDHPIAVPPGIGNGEIELVAAGLAIADDVEPVAGKPFAEVGGCEQPVDILLIRERIGIGDDAIDIGRIGRKAGEQLGGPADELRPRSLGRRGEPGGLQARQYEAVDVAAAPADGPNRGDRHGTRRLPAPVIGLAGGDVEARRTGLHRALDGPGEAAANPFLERGDRLGGQPAIRRHLQLAVIANDLDEQALLRLPRRRQPLVAEGLGTGVEGKVPLRFAGRAGVAGRAMLEEQRPDPRFEELGIRGRRCRGQRGGGPCQANDGRSKHHPPKRQDDSPAADLETCHVDVLRGPRGPGARRPARPRSAATPTAGRRKPILPPCSQIGTAKTGLDSHGISPQRRAGEILAVD